jgi:lipopolysaccharide/colanic/teichoic acid biosynthesis glycosyltransferase
MNDQLFFALEPKNVRPDNSGLANRYHYQLWRPSATRIVPRGMPLLPFGAWWLLHHLHVFANRDYSLLLIDDGHKIVHRSCVFPRYFRFPFMSRCDLQIGDTWTADEHRGQNLAVFAAQKVFELHRTPRRRFWYICSDSNGPSIRVAEKAGFTPVGKGRRISRWGLRPLGAFMMEQDIPKHTQSRPALILKRLFDFFAALFGLILFSPLLLAVALWVKLDSQGPVFYRGRRAGRNGKPFGIFKFRSMVVNADRIGGPSTAGDDARVTRSGRLIRRCKLDELTQLLNVLVGQMSLVGPRPEIVDKVALYSPAEMEVLALRPGITDWASIWNADEGGLLAGTPDPDDAYEKILRPTKIQLQLHYCRTRTFLSDIKIIFCTIWKILHKRWVPRELQDYPTFTQLRVEVEKLIADQSARDDRRAA